MAKQPNYYRQIIRTLQRLEKSHPTYNIGRHLSTALDEYNDLWGVSDKELLYALEKYEVELNIDYPHVDEEELKEIIKGGMNLERMFDEEED
jgi:hypothetical protein